MELYNKISSLWRLTLVLLISLVVAVTYISLAQGIIISSQAFGLAPVANIGLAKGNISTQAFGLASQPLLNILRFPERLHHHNRSQTWEVDSADATGQRLHITEKMGALKASGYKKASCKFCAEDQDGVVGFVYNAGLIPAQDGKQCRLLEKISGEVSSNQTEYAFNLAFAQHIRFKQSHASRKSQSPRFLCIVYTHKGAIRKLQGIRETWAPKCTGFIAAADYTNVSLGAVKILHRGPESYRNLWAKTQSALGYVHENYIDQFDYFFFAGDDSFVVVENLFDFLESSTFLQSAGVRSHDALVNTPIMVGNQQAYKKTHKEFISGSGGYIINRAGVKTLVANMDEEECEPRSITSAEDVFVSFCLVKHGGKLISANRHFLSWRPAAWFNGIYFKKVWVAKKEGVRCCEKELVNLHYMTPREQRWFFSYLYCRRAEQDT